MAGCPALQPVADALLAARRAVRAQVELILPGTAAATPAGRGEGEVVPSAAPIRVPAVDAAAPAR